jgi:DNA-directed RNA polymerase subunit K/omega
MSDRKRLINRLLDCGMNPFLLCNVAGRRLRQLTTQRSAGICPQLIDVALAELRDGKLRYEVRSAPGGQQSAEVVKPEGLADLRVHLPESDAILAAVGR